MGEQAQEDHPTEVPPLEQAGNQPPVEAGQTSADQQTAANSPKKQKFNIWHFTAGFLGWFLVTGLIFIQKMDDISLMFCAGIIFLLNMAVLIFLLIKLRSAGLGMLSALGLNFVISLILGLVGNALCFIPFYRPY